MDSKGNIRTLDKPISAEAAKARGLALLTEEEKRQLEAVPPDQRLAALRRIREGRPPYVGGNRRQRRLAERDARREARKQRKED